MIFLAYAGHLVFWIARLCTTVREIRRVVADGFGSGWVRKPGCRQVNEFLLVFTSRVASARATGGHTSGPPTFSLACVGKAFLGLSAYVCGLKRRKNAKPWLFLTGEPVMA